MESARGFLAQPAGVVAVARDDEARVGDGTRHERPRLDQGIVPLVSFTCAHAADDESVRPLNPVGRGAGHGGSSRATHRHRNVGKQGIRSTKSRDGVRRYRGHFPGALHCRALDRAKRRPRLDAHQDRQQPRPAPHERERHRQQVQVHGDHQGIAGRCDALTQRERRETNPTTARRVKCRGGSRQPGPLEVVQRPHLEARRHRVRHVIPARAPIGASSRKCRPRLPSSA